MKIGYAYPFEIWPTSGGNKLHAFQLTQRFLDAGHEVITLDDGSLEGLQPVGSPEAFLRTADVAYVRVDGYPLRDLPKIHSILAHSEIPLVIELNSPANEKLAFSWLGGEERPSRGFRRPMDTLKRSLHARRALWGIRKEDRLRRRLASRWDAAICVSKAVEEYARQQLGVDTTIVIPNGSDPKLMTPEVAPIDVGAPDGDLVVLYAGSPKYPWQGLRLLRQVIEEAWEERLPLYFLLLAHQTSAFIPDLPNTRLITGVQYSDMACHINAADVCVSLQPEFHWSPWLFHGSPTKFFDYLACGRPVLASNVGQMREVILEWDCGLLCEYEASDVKEKLMQLRSDGNLRRRLGRNGRIAVEQEYNWDRVASITLGLFEALLTGR